MKLMMMTMVKVLMVMVTMMMVMVTGPGSTWPTGTVAVTQFGEKIQIAKSILLLFRPIGGGSIHGCRDREMLLDEVDQHLHLCRLDSLLAWPSLYDHNPVPGGRGTSAPPHLPLLKGSPWVPGSPWVAPSSPHKRLVDATTMVVARVDGRIVTSPLHLYITATFSLTFHALLRRITTIVGW